MSNTSVSGSDGSSDSFGDISMGETDQSTASSQSASDAQSSVDSSGMRTRSRRRQLQNSQSSLSSIASQSSIASSNSTNISQRSNRNGSQMSQRSNRSGSQMSLRSSRGGSQMSQRLNRSGSDDSANTEEYDLGQVQVGVRRVNVNEGDGNVDPNVIEINDTQAAPPMEEDDDDDVVLIPQHIDVIDLCTQAAPTFRFPVNPADIIEIQDSPAPAARGNRMRTSTARRTQRNNSTSPYQLPNQNAGTSKAKPTTSNIAELQDLSATQSPGIKIKCPICLESASTKKKLVSTVCGHVFCNKCLTDSLSVAKKCPMCRKTLTGKNAFHPLFFFE